MEIPGPRSGEARRLKGFAPVAAADIVDTAQEAAGQEPPPLIVRESLAAYLEERGLGSGELSAERIGEGHSNITFLVTLGDERVVLRRPPRPPIPPSAHDVLREAKVLTAVQDTAVRVPRVLAVCDDESVLGVPFYVMEEVKGTVITTAIPEPLDNPEQRTRIGEELIDALAEIHDVDWQAAGLEGFGKPTGYLDRQLRRFNGLWEHNKTRELPRVQEVGDWLAANKPESAPSTIVHGDYRLRQAGARAIDDRARRLPARQRDGCRRGAGPPRGHLRLGAVHDRRPPGRPR